MFNIYFWIFILLIVIFLLDYSDKHLITKRIKENFNNLYQENNLVTFTPPNTPQAVNFNTSNNYFKNFATNGMYPPYMKCPSCKLQFDCTNYPYEVSDKNETTCTNCLEKTYLDPYYNLKVYAKSNGAPRACKDIIETK
jgi:hypothetical protein